MERRHRHWRHLILGLIMMTTMASCSALSSKDPNLEREGVHIIFLHHSTGGVIWDGGVADWFEAYNSANDTDYLISERAYPGEGYPWNNYPYDYWNIWIQHEGEKPFQKQDTLEILTEDYEVVVWKHCFPVSSVEPDTGSGDVSSEIGSLENYKLQYEALKQKMHDFPQTKFIVWTGAALVAGATDVARAERAQEFFEWVKTDWDEPGDNIYLWDFYQLETEGGPYLLDEYAASSEDSHPNSTFASRVAPFFSQRVVDVIEGRGDSGSLTGE